MKLYKIKDTIAIGWFIILIYLLNNKYYKVVTVLLIFGMLADLIITITDIGDTDILFVS